MFSSNDHRRLTPRLAASNISTSSSSRVVARSASPNELVVDSTAQEMSSAATKLTAGTVLSLDATEVVAGAAEAVVDAAGRPVTDSVHGSSKYTGISIKKQLIQQ